MPHYFVKQPDNKYAIFSTVVDDFVCFDCTAKEAIEQDMIRDFGKYPGGNEQLEKDLRREIGNIEVDGKAWPWADTWDEAVKWSIEMNGPDSESTQWIIEAGFITLEQATKIYNDEQEERRKEELEQGHS